jgi:mRNA interferase RelE/StbE
MDSFELIWRSSAERELRGLDYQYIPRIAHAVGLLAADPFPPQCRKLQGTEQDFRIRVGDYRVIYQVDTKARVVTICRIRHRAVAYRR